MPRATGEIVVACRPVARPTVDQACVDSAAPSSASSAAAERQSRERGAGTVAIAHD